MDLFDILHSDDECTMSKTIVASHTCVGIHHFVTWNFHELFELWGENFERAGYEKLKSFTYLGPGLGMTYDDAAIIAEEVFEDWLTSIPE